MAKSYYYIVAGLPDFVLDEQKQVAPFAEFMAEVKEQVSAADAELLSIVQRPADNRNLVRLLEKSGRAFDSDGNFTEDELSQAAKTYDGLPAYMQTFLDARRDGRVLFEGRSADDALAWLFYDEAAQHANAFIAEWFLFDLRLRNVLAAINCRGIARAQGADAQALIGRAVIAADETADALCKSTAPDFSLSGRLPWIETVLALEGKSLMEREKRIDEMRAEVLEEMTRLSHFQIETVLAFAIRLGMANRWRRLDAQRGKEMLDRLLADLGKARQANVEDEVPSRTRAE